MRKNDAIIEIFEYVITGLKNSIEKKGEKEEEKGQIPLLQQKLAEVRLNLVDFFREHGRDEKAEEEASKLAELYRKMGPDYLYHLAKLDYRILDPERGKEELERMARALEQTIFSTRAEIVDQSYITKAEIVGRLHKQYSLLRELYSDIGDEEKVEKKLREEVDLVEAIDEDREHLLYLLAPILAPLYEKLEEKEKAQRVFLKVAQQWERGYSRIRTMNIHFKQIAEVGLQLAFFLKKSNQIEKAKEVLEELGTSALFRSLFQKCDDIALICFARLREERIVRGILHWIIKRAEEDGRVLRKADALTNLAWLNRDSGLSMKARELCLAYAGEKEKIFDFQDKEDAVLLCQKAIEILKNKRSNLERIWEEESIYTSLVNN